MRLLFWRVKLTRVLPRFSNLLKIDPLCCRISLLGSFGNYNFWFRFLIFFREITIILLFWIWNLGFGYPQDHWEIILMASRTGLFFIFLPNFCHIWWFFLVEVHLRCCRTLKNHQICVKGWCVFIYLHFLDLF